MNEVWDFRANLYLPALPVEYEADRLKSIIQGETTPWYHLVHWQVRMYFWGVFDFSCITEAGYPMLKFII